MARMFSHEGQCRHCMRRRQVLPIGRTGGGTYRRGGRWYRSSICVECAEKLDFRRHGYAGETIDRFSGREISQIVTAHYNDNIVKEEE